MQQTNVVFNSAGQPESMPDEYFNVVQIPIERKPIIEPNLEVYSDMVGDHTQEDDTSQSSSISNNNSIKQEAVIDKPDIEITKQSNMVDSSCYIRNNLDISIKDETAKEVPDHKPVSPIVESKTNQNDSFYDKNSDMITDYKKINIDEDTVKDSEETLEKKLPMNNNEQLNTANIDLKIIDANLPSTNKSVVSPI